MTIFLVHEDRAHVEALPEEVPIAVRAALFTRQGAGLVVVMLGVVDEIYETWWNFHNPAFRRCFDDICEQDKLLVSFYVDHDKPERLVWIPNTLRARFRPAVDTLRSMPPWEMADFDRAREDVYAEHPTPRALWDAMSES